jgi:hypothetical protein
LPCMHLLYMKYEDSLDISF